MDGPALEMDRLVAGTWQTELAPQALTIYGDPERYQLYQRIVKARDPRLDLNQVLPTVFNSRVVVGPPDPDLYRYFKRMQLVEVFRSLSGFVMVTKAQDQMRSVPPKPGSTGR